MAAVRPAMRHLVASLCALLACSSDPGEDDGGSSDESTGGSEAGGTESTAAGSSDNAESGSGSGDAVDLSCLESTPVQEPTCRAVWLELAGAAGSKASPPENSDCSPPQASCDPSGEWATADVVVAVLEDPEAAPIFSVAMPCGADPALWMPMADDFVVWIDVSWRATYGAGELVYQCSDRRPIDSYGAAAHVDDLGDHATICVPAPPHPSATTLDDCCLVSGTPTPESELPTDPC